MYRSGPSERKAGSFVAENAIALDLLPAGRLPGLWIFWSRVPSIPILCNRPWQNRPPNHRVCRYRPCGHPILRLNPSGRIVGEFLLQERSSEVAEWSAQSRRFTGTPAIAGPHDILTEIHRSGLTSMGQQWRSVRTYIRGKTSGKTTTLIQLPLGTSFSTSKYAPRHGPRCATRCHLRKSEMRF